MNNERGILKQLIVSSYMSQKMISIKSGISEVQISRWVTGKETPKLSSLNKIAKSVGCELILSIKKTSV